MVLSATFIVPKRELLNVLKHLQKIEKSGKKKESTLEVTILNGRLKLVIPGIELIVPAITSGSAKFSIRLWYFTDIVKTEKDRELNFTLADSQLELRGFSFNVLSTFFKNDRILRSINLPVNYTYNDIVKLYLSEKYTTEEIIFNNLDKEIGAAINKLNADVDKITSIIRQYGFTREEIVALLTNKLKDDFK